MPAVKCPECPAVMDVADDMEAGETTVQHLGSGFHQATTVHQADKPKRVKHNADGSTSVTPVTPPKARTDPKPRGRRRG